MHAKKIGGPNHNTTKRRGDNSLVLLSLEFATGCKISLLFLGAKMRLSDYPQQGFILDGCDRLLECWKFGREALAKFFQANPYVKKTPARKPAFHLTVYRYLWADNATPPNPIL